jgi:hypothetical protein
MSKCRIWICTGLWFAWLFILTNAISDLRASYDLGELSGRGFWIAGFCMLLTLIAPIWLANHYEVHHSGNKE